MPYSARREEGRESVENQLSLVGYFQRTPSILEPKNGPFFVAKSAVLFSNPIWSAVLTSSLPSVLPVLSSRSCNDEITPGRELRLHRNQRERGCYVKEWIGLADLVIMCRLGQFVKCK